MNERILELARQANVLESEHYDNELEIQKFAELIIKECTNVIQREVSMKYKDGGETEEFMGGHYAGSLLARVKIKHHFGVKE
jgi:hypothetical protein